MKKDLSVLILMVRNSFWRVVGATLSMLAFESVFFFTDTDLVHGYTISLEELLTGKIIGLGFLMGTVSLLAGFATFGSDIRGKETYTLRRLRISERRVWFWQAIFHTGCFLLIYFAEAWLLVSLCRYYLIHSTVQPASDQMIWMAITRNTFLLNLLPLQNPLRWLRNFTLILSLGLTSAPGPMGNRIGQSAYAVLPLHFLTMLVFMINIKTWQLDLLVTIIAMMLAGYAVYGVWKAGEKHGS